MTSRSWPVALLDPLPGRRVHRDGPRLAVGAAGVVRVAGRGGLVARPRPRWLSASSGRPRRSSSSPSSSVSVASSSAPSSSLPPSSLGGGALADDGDDLADRDLVVDLGLEFLDGAGDGGGDLGVDLVGRDLDDGLVDGDLVADLDEPGGDDALGDGLAQLGQFDLGSHVRDSCVRASASGPLRTGSGGSGGAEPARAYGAARVVGG